jgi:hypothetical protein
MEVESQRGGNRENMGAISMGRENMSIESV